MKKSTENKHYYNTELNMENHYRSLEKMYLNANCNSGYYTGLTIQINEGSAVIELPVNKKYFHASNSMHGSVYYKLLNDAAFFAVTSVVKDVMVMTVSYQLNIIRTVTSGKIIATGTLLKQGKNRFFSRSELVDSSGKTVATGTGNFLKSRILLNTEIGYGS